MKERFSIYPKMDAVCIGCGRTLRKSAPAPAVEKNIELEGDPRFTYSFGKGQKQTVCMVCAYLHHRRTDGKQNEPLRPGEFRDWEKMANVHKKHLDELRALRKQGEHTLDILRDYGVIRVIENEQTRRDK